jgi:hypothetical protein
MKVFLYIFTMLTAAGCVKLLLNLYNAGISKKWPEYSATIIESGYEKVEGLEGGVGYRVIIKYQYIVGGVQYENSNYDFCNQSVDKYEREQLLVRYPVGKKITVRVNPKNPGSAVIVAGVTYWHYIWLILCFAFLYLLLKAL